MARKKFKKILVALDGSKNSLRGLTKAIMLAKLMSAQITGIFVIQAYPTETGIIRTIVGKALSKKCKNFMSIAKSKCKKNNVGFFDAVEFGEEGQTIVSFAEKNNYDMIVVGSRGMGIIKESFLGSTSSHVVHDAKIPVLVVK
jgi:nucleotide-binding universal stress UspA family protein